MYTELQFLTCIQFTVSSHTSTGMGIGIGIGQYYWVLGALFGIVLTLKKERKNRRLTATTSRMRRDAPFEPTDPDKVCMWGGVADVIKGAKFFKIHQRFSELSESENPHFPYVPLKSFIALSTVSALPCRTVILMTRTVRITTRKRS